MTPVTHLNIWILVFISSLIVTCLFISFPVEEMLELFSTYQTGQSFICRELLTLSFMFPNIMGSAEHFMALVAAVSF